MTKRIQFNIIQFLFRLFSFLADKTGGWAMFVKPKILLGSVVLGLTACSSNTKQDDVSCYVVDPPPLEQTAIENSDDIENLSENLDDSIKISAPAITINIVENTDNAVIIDVPPVIPIIETVMCYDPIICYVIVESEPNFPGGTTELYKFLQKNIRYPKVCLEDNIQGRVVCQFYVERDGSVSNVEVIKSVHPILDEEAVRVIESMPKWMPGKQHGQTVRVKYELPVNFKLQ